MKRWPLLAAALLAAALWWALTGVWIVEQNEKGVVLTFGAATRVAPAGLHFTLPAPLGRMVVVPATDVRTVTVGVASQAELDSDRFDDDNPEWLTGDTNIVDLKLAVQFEVDDPVAWLFGVDADTGPDAAPGGHALLVRKLTEGAVTALVAEMPIDVVLSSGKGPLQRETKERVQAELDQLGAGIRLVSVNVSEASAPRQVIAAFNDVASADADAKRELDDADGFRRDRIPAERAAALRLVRSAEAYALETVRDAEGRANAFLELTEALAAEPEVTRRQLLYDTWTAILEGAEKKVYDAREGEPFRYNVVE